MNVDLEDDLEDWLGKQEYRVTFALFMLLGFPLRITVYR